MKSNRRKFIQNLGAGAAGITLGTQHYHYHHAQQVPLKKRQQMIRYFL